MSLAEFGPLAADLCIMVLITVLFYMKNFKIYFVILLALEGATLGYNLFIILETIILYFQTIHSQSDGLKDVTMNCDYFERIFIIRITLLFISTVLIITFSLVSVQLFKDTLTILKFSPISVFLLKRNFLDKIASTGILIPKMITIGAKVQNSELKSDESYR